jgi:arylformamidase
MSRRYIDLSVTVGPTIGSPPFGGQAVEITTHRLGPGHWVASSVRQSLHAGAHIDAPLHVFRDGITAAEIRLEQVIGEALVVDLSHVKPEAGVTIDDLRQGGAGDLRPGDIALLRTGWSDEAYGRWPDYFTRSPFLPPESAEWLVARGPKAVGVDFFAEYCGRLPDFSSEDAPMHRIVLGAGVVILEGLTNLGALPGPRVEFGAPFFKIAGTEAAPARFYAVV